MYSLQANGKSLLKDDSIAGGLFITKSVLLSNTHEITLTNQCTNCAQEFTHLISVELTKNKSVKIQSDPSKKLIECNSYVGGDCLLDPENCIFEYVEMAHIPCYEELKFIKISNDTKKCPQLNCKYKCVRNLFTSDEECDKYCPYECSNKKCNLPNI